MGYRAVHPEGVLGGEDIYLNKEAKFRQGRRQAMLKTEPPPPEKVLRLARRKLNIP
jgi:hypothetical protein